MNTTALDVPVKSVETVWVRRFAKCAAVFVAALALAWPCAAAERKETIVILLDASGSMKAVFPGSPGTRIDAAKNAIKTVVRKVPQSTEIGLLVFSAKNLKDDWAFPLGPRDDARMFATLDSIECHTDTPLGKYLKIAADRLLEERAKRFGYGSYRLIVLTDGEAQDQDLVNRYTPDIVSRGITVDAIGVGMKRAHTLATKVHSYRGANDMKALDQALGEVFAEVRDGGNDAAEGQAFAVIGPLPDGLADAMIGALANAPNTPIGEGRIAPVKASQIQSQQAAPVPAAAPASPPSATPAQPVTPQEPLRKKRSSGGAVAVVITVLIVAVFAARAVRRGGRRR